MADYPFSSVGKILNDHDKVVVDIKKNRKLPKYFVEGNLIILLCSLAFGAALGSYLGGYQMLINSFKIPLLFFVTLYISMPVFYILNTLTGTKTSLFQTVQLLVSGYSVAAVVLIAFTPLMFFFMITSKEYTFTIFLTMGVMGLAGWFGIVYIFKNYLKFHGPDSKKWLPSFLIGSFVIMFVGTQLGWTLRPYFHPYGDFIRPVSGNFYVAMAQAAGDSPGIAALIILIFGFIAFVATLVMIAKWMDKSFADKATGYDPETKKKGPARKQKTPPIPNIPPGYQVYPYPPGLIPNEVPNKN